MGLRAPRVSADRGVNRPASRELPGIFPITHGSAEIVRDLDVANGWMLLLDGIQSSYVDLDDPTNLEFEYMQWIAAVLDSLAVSGEPLDTLHLGGGAATLPRYVAATRPGSRQLVFEYDEKLIDVVRRMLPLPSSRRLRIRGMEARAGLARQRDASFDVIIRDAFAGPTVPSHLATTEFSHSVRRVLRDNGIYLANIADSAPLHAVRAEAATLLHVFDRVLLMAEPSVLRGRRYGNVVFVASQQPLPVGEVARRVARGAAPARVYDKARVRDLAGTRQPNTD
jgi:spermidine synthase